MTTYFDSSALVAIYVTEAFSARAREQARRVSQIPFTLLHDLEVRNALLLLEGRRMIDAGQRRALMTQLDEDLQDRRLATVAMDLVEVFRRAHTLAQAHSAKLLCRSLDILHVAAALELGCIRLVSGDGRQLALARAAGLKSRDVGEGALGRVRHPGRA